MNVLIVDNDRRFQMIAEHKLSKRGFKFFACENDKAVAILKREKIDSVLMISSTHDEEIMEYIRAMEKPPLMHYFGPEESRELITHLKAQSL